MMQSSTRRATASIAIVLGLLASLAGCEQRTPDPATAPATGAGTTTTPAPMPPASGASQ